MSNRTMGNLMCIAAAMGAVSAGEFGSAFVCIALSGIILSRENRRDGN